MRKAMIMTALRTLALLAALAATPVTAQTAPQVYRLSPAEITRLQAESSLRTTSPFDAANLPRPRDGRVHGEVGVGIGTSGYREVYGAIGVPLGETGNAQFAFDVGQFDNGQFNGYRRGVRTHPVPVR